MKFKTVKDIKHGEYISECSTPSGIGKETMCCQSERDREVKEEVIKQIKEYAKDHGINLTKKWWQIGRVEIKRWRKSSTHTTYNEALAIIIFARRLFNITNEDLK